MSDLVNLMKALLGSMLVAKNRVFEFDYLNRWTLSSLFDFQKNYVWVLSMFDTMVFDTSLERLDLKQCLIKVTFGIAF